MLGKFWDKHKHFLIPFSLSISGALVFSFIFHAGSVNEFYNDEIIADTIEGKITKAHKAILASEFDWRTRLKSPKPFPDNVVIVQINEPSLKKFGQFPFPRGVYAKLIKILEKSGAKGLSFDILFSEPSNQNVLKELENISQKVSQGEAKKIIGNAISSLNQDKLLADAILDSKMPIALGYIMLIGDGSINMSEQEYETFVELNKLPHYLTVKNQDTKFESIYSNTYDGITAPMPELWLKSRAHSAFFSLNFERDAVIRKAPVIAKFGDDFFPGLALRSAIYHNGNLKNSVQIYENPIKGALSLRFTAWSGERLLNPDGTVYLNYYGKDNRPQYFELSELFEEEKNVNSKILSQLKDKVVLIGATAAGLNDIRSSPYSDSMPGTEILATAAANIINGDFIQRAPKFFMGFGLFFLLMALVYSVISFYFYFPFAVATLTASFLGMNWYSQVQFEQGWFVPLFPITIHAFFTFFIFLIYRYLSSEKEKKYVRQAFSRYVSSDVVKEILKDKEKLKLGGDKKELTVLFADMAGFTKLSEKLSAEDLSKRLNELFTELTAVILNNRGTLDKYMGDAIMCFWGAPLEQADHSHRACKSAIEMYQALQKINQRWKTEFGIAVDMRIGINTGEMNVGNMGSEQLFSYTVLGDNVNLGSRLEGINNFYGTKIVVGENTAKLVKNEFSMRLLDRVAVKGKEKAVEIYELLLKPYDQTGLKYFAEALNAYFVGDFADAKILFEKASEKNPDDGACHTFLDRITKLKSPPQNWDGVWRMQEK